MKIPKDGQIRQINSGDIYGELTSTCNIDLATNPGKIKLARPFKRTAVSTDLGSESVEGISFYSGDILVLTNRDLYTSSDFSSWTAIDGIIPDGAQDLIIFDGQLRISGTDDIGNWDFSSDISDDWWLSDISGTALTPGVPHIMEVDYGGSEALVVTDGSIVRRYEADSATHYEVDIHPTHTATCVKPAIRSLWIGSFTEDAEQALVYQWDGASDNYIQAFPVGAKAVLAMEIVDDTPYIVTERGEIKAFNNSGFVTVASLPFSLKPLFADGVESGLIQTSNLARPIHPKGMRYSNGSLFIFTNFLTSDGKPLDERSPNGLWEYNLQTRVLSHRALVEGDSIFSGSSPLLVVNDPKGRFVVAPRLDTAHSTDTRGVWVEDLSDDSTNSGYLITPDITPSGINGSFNDSHIKALLGSSDNIVIKYRGKGYTSLPLSFDNGFTWKDSRTLNTTEDLSAAKEIIDSGEKLELEIITGSASGKLSEIDTIEAAASVYSITLKDDVGTADDTCGVRIDNWTLLETYDEGAFKRIGLNSTDTYVQLKVILNGQAGYPEVREITVSNNTKTK